LGLSSTIVAVILFSLKFIAVGNEISYKHLVIKSEHRPAIRDVVAKIF